MIIQSIEKISGKIFVLVFTLVCLMFIKANVIAESLFIKELSFEQLPLRADLLFSGEQTQIVNANINKISEGKYRISALTRNNLKVPLVGVLTIVTEKESLVFPFEVNDSAEVLMPNELSESIGSVNSDILSAQAELDKLNRRYEILRKDARLIGDIGDIEALNASASELQFELSSLNSEKQIREKNISEFFTLESDPYIQLQLDEVQSDLLKLRQTAGKKTETMLAADSTEIKALSQELEELKIQRRMLEERINERNY